MAAGNGSEIVPAAEPAAPRAVQRVPALNLLTPTGFETAMRFASVLVESGFLPVAVNTPAKALAIIQAGLELGIPPMKAFRCIYIVEGKPVMSTEFMLERFRARGGRVEWLESTNEVARIRVTARNGDVREETFTIDDARRAQLLGKSNWIRYPKPMLRARCASAAVKALGESEGTADLDDVTWDPGSGGPVVDVEPVDEAPQPGDPLSETATRAHAFYAALSAAPATREGLAPFEAEVRCDPLLSSFPVQGRSIRDHLRRRLNEIPVEGSTISI